MTPDPLCGIPQIWNTGVSDSYLTILSHQNLPETCSPIKVYESNQINLYNTNLIDCLFFLPLTN